MMKKLCLFTALTFILSQNLFAQATGGAPAGAQNPLMQFLPLVLIFVVFYFLMLRPQQKKLKEEQEMLSKLNKGDEVFTKSGILGTVHGLTEKVVTLDTGDGNKIKLLRSQIGGLAASILENK